MAKIEIINYYDSLINRVDIDIDECIENYHEEQILSELNCYKIENRKFKSLRDFSLLYYQTETNSSDQWSESTKVIDYLNQIRIRTIDELKKAQEERIEYLKLNSTQFNAIREDELRGELYKGKFHFQVLYKPDPKYSVSWIFRWYTFITDFYMSPNDIDLLQSFINSTPDHEHDDADDKEEVIEDEYRIKPKESDFKYIFDEKMILIGLLQKQFFKNLKTKSFPNSVISVCKQDLLNIKRICFRYQLIEVNLTASKELSNLESLYLEGGTKQSSEIKIEGLRSLKFIELKCCSTVQIAFKNLELIQFNLDLIGSINSEIVSRIYDNLSYIQILYLNATYLCEFNLDRFVNLTALVIVGRIQDDFNVSLFDNLCNRLEQLVLICDIDNERFAKLFHARTFPFLHKLFLKQTSITRIEKKMFDSFPVLESLLISENRRLRIIHPDAFSNSKHLCYLDLSSNRIRSISDRHFSNIKLKTLDLSKNRLKSIDKNVFSNQIESLETLDLSNNKFSSLDRKLFDYLKNLKSLGL